MAGEADESSSILPSLSLSHSLTLAEKSGAVLSSLFLMEAAGLAAAGLSSSQQGGNLKLAKRGSSNRFPAGEQPWWW